MNVLENIVVLDLTRALSGPFTTMILGDFGADIIKFEPPEGDMSRAWPPHVNNESAFFMSPNRSKRSIVINLKEREARELFKKMVVKADVVAENFRPGVMDKFGLGYDTLKEINPRLVYLATSGFGQTGPYRLFPAYDQIVQAMGGIMSLTGEEGGRGTRVGESVGDLVAGVYGALGVMLALYARETTGKGQLVDISMLDGMLAFLENAIARYLYSGKIPGPVGNRHASIHPFESYPAADGDVVIAAANPKQWENLCTVLGRKDLIADPRFINNVKRLENRPDLNKIIIPIIRQKNSDEWLRLLQDAQIPCARVDTVDKILQNPQVIAREMILEMDHTVVGKIKVPGVPVKLSETPGRPTLPPPTFGQHTQEIMRQLLGMDADEVEKLKKKGVLG